MEGELDVWVSLATLAIYFVPFIIALVRGCHNVVGIFWINFLLGWTLIGWCVALAMSARRATEKTQNQDSEGVEIELDHIEHHIIKRYQPKQEDQL